MPPSSAQKPVDTSLNRSHVPRRPPEVLPFMVMVSEVVEVGMDVPAMSVVKWTAPARMSVEFAT